jgi:hypothetical protein
MKKQSVNTIAKKLFFGNIIAAVLFLSFQNKAQASYHESLVDSAISTVINKSEKVLVKYISNNEDGVFFNVKYNNEKGETFNVVINDQSGEELYSGTFDDKNFDKKFLLPKDVAASTITIAVTSGKEDFIQTYSLNTKAVMSLDVVARKN